jgi:hypothetical protein
MSADGVPLQWRLRAAPAPENLREERRRFLGFAQTALRAGHGLGAEFGLSVTSGPAGRIECTPQDVVARRWFTRALLPIYDRGRWVPVRAPASGGEVSCLYGTRVRGWPDPLRPDETEASACDAIGLALRAAVSGARMEWTFRPTRLSFALPSNREDPVPLPTRPLSGRTVRSGPTTPRPPPPPTGEPCFWSCELRVRAPGPPGLLYAAGRTLESTLRTDGGNGVRFRRSRWAAAFDAPFLISDRELALILPSWDEPRAGACEAPASNHRRRVVLGRTDSGNIVAVGVEPSEGRHLAVLGETGMGKSSLLVAMGRQATAYAGVALLDPLGDTADSFRRLLGPGDRERATIVSPLSTPGLNALEGIGPAHADPATRERRLNDLVHALRRVRSGRYADGAFWGPRLEEMLQRALSVAASIPDGTLEDAHLLLASGGRGFRQLPPEATELANGLAERIRSRPEDAEGARRLLYEVVRSPTLVRALCRRTSEVLLPQLVGAHRILVLSGDAPRVGESNARFFLSVYLALLWSTLLARDASSKFFVLLDEAQWFAHESLSEMLRLGRRRNLHTLLATQSIASLPESVQEAVWTNVADFVAFRGSPIEAREFSRLVQGLGPESILGLPRGHAAALLGKGQQLRWVRTVRPPSFGRPESYDTSEDGAQGSSPRTSHPTGPGATPGRVDSKSRDEAVWSAIGRRFGAAASDSTVRVSLAELRNEADPEGNAIRNVGGRLGRAGAIVRTEHGAEGTVWWLDRRHAAPLARPPAIEPGEAGSGGPQPS